MIDVDQNWIIWRMKEEILPNFSTSSLVKSGTCKHHGKSNDSMLHQSVVPRYASAGNPRHKSSKNETSVVRQFEDAHACEL